MHCLQQGEELPLHVSLLLNWESLCHVNTYHLSFYTVSLSAHVSYGQHIALFLPVERGQGNTPFSFTQCYSSWKTGRVTWSVLQVHYSPGYYGMEMHEEEPKIAGQLSQQLTLDLARKKEGSKD